MMCRFIRYSVITAFAVAAGLVLAPLAEAQAPAGQTATPRLTDGHPDLSGFWAAGAGGGGGEEGPASYRKRAISLRWRCRARAIPARKSAQDR